jgi:hypothetical protein
MVTIDIKDILKNLATTGTTMLETKEITEKAVLSIRHDFKMPRCK